MMGGSYTGPSVPRPSSSKSNEDRVMDFDDHRDYMDRDNPAGQFLLLILDQVINS
jgi:hypothetical protein